MSEAKRATDAVADHVDQPRKDIDAQSHPERTAGIMEPYSGACVLPVNLAEIQDKESGETHHVPMCLLGQDTRTKKLTVLGGRYDPADSGPLYTACRELWEETIGSTAESVDALYNDVEELYYDKEIPHVKYVQTKHPYHIFLTPCELSHAMLGAFQDRLKEYKSTGAVKAIEGKHANPFKIDEKSALVWVPIGPAAKDEESVSWFARKILHEVTAHFARNSYEKKDTQQGAGEGSSKDACESECASKDACESKCASKDACESKCASKDSVEHVG
mgnify:CR=1 FL=1